MQKLRKILLAERILFAVILINLFGIGVVYQLEKNRMDGTVLVVAIITYMIILYFVYRLVLRYFIRKYGD